MSWQRIQGHRCFKMATLIPRMEEQDIAVQDGSDISPKQCLGCQSWHSRAHLEIAYGAQNVVLGFGVKYDELQQTRPASSLP